MQPKAAAALGDYCNWSALNESLGPLVNAAYLEIEAEVF
jgi:hypothetical protein